MTSSNFYIMSHDFLGAAAWLSHGVVIIVCRLVSSPTVAAALLASSTSCDCVKMNWQLQRLEGNMAS